MKLKTSAILLLCPAAFAAGSLPTAAATLQQIKAQGYVRAATANEVPYGYMDADGKAKGIAPEVLEAVLAKMGLKDIQWSVTPFGSLIPGLKANRFDVVAAEQDILPARCQQVLFSEPNSSYGDNLLVAKGNPKNLHSYEDVKKNPAIKLAVVNGTSHLAAAEGVGITEDQLVVIANNADAPATVSGGRADAYAATDSTVASLVKGDLEAASPFTDPVVKGKTLRGFGGFAFQKDSGDFVAEFNKVLADFKKTDDYKKILKSYNVTDASIAASSTKSTADLCADK
ncbi:ectoine/hydroxyectoine ABC transporter substrate-binding protein EhuB [Rhizobium tropici]|uniref:Ectoine/hydroxyectoine ABC transporter substrate-binding protein EhuB n=1 Tax=Rhizobium tropici TaxID=398 RepID=A0A5B0WAZ0_RHITR|nr:ectoine/hydroxyectoine ABC transporter substrate-binding protein EhuB [Rhizobium tropici]KAA1183079.1 ectoine/hydroxyectoine ABC transporter substrate-binding protein EhuB [Rhizobium tropici]